MQHPDDIGILVLEVTQNLVRICHYTEGRVLSWMIELVKIEKTHTLRYLLIEPQRQPIEKSVKSSFDITKLIQGMLRLHVRVGQRLRKQDIVKGEEIQKNAVDAVDGVDDPKWDQSRLIPFENIVYYVDPKATEPNRSVVVEQHNVVGGGQRRLLRGTILVSKWCLDAHHGLRDIEIESIMNTLNFN